MKYRYFNDNTILMVFPWYLLIKATFSMSENGIWKLSIFFIETLNLILKIFEFQHKKKWKKKLGNYTCLYRFSISRGRNETVGNEGLPMTAIGTLNKCSIEALPIIQTLLLVFATQATLASMVTLSQHYMPTLAGCWRQPWFF